MVEQGLLLVVSGPSGAGKGTICRSLMAQRPGLQYSVSATTREPRQGEIDGVHYKFVPKDRFEEMIASDELLEWAPVYDNYYGTPKKMVQDSLKAGKDIILEIDIQGALQIKEKFPGAVFVFIVPPSLDELEKRITNRATDSPEVIAKRMKAAVSELSYISQYDYVIINDQVDRAVGKLDAIIQAEKCRPKRANIEIH